MLPQFTNKTSEFLTTARVDPLLQFAVPQVKKGCLRGTGE
jgi:hypothetical protein